MKTVCHWCGWEAMQETGIICIVHDREVCGNCGMCRKVAVEAHKRKEGVDA